MKHLSPELCKHLKDKGFSRCCTHYFLDINGQYSKYPCRTSDYKYLNWNAVERRLSCPEPYQVVEWVLEKYGIWILVDWSQTKWCSSVIDVKEETLKRVSKNKDWKERHSGVYLKTILDCNSPTEAYIVAIEYLKRKNLIV